MDDRRRKKGIYNINGEFFPVFLEHEISDVGWHALGYEKEGWSIST